MTNFHEKQRQMKEQMAKEAIYEAAMTVLSEKGSDNLKMQDIAEKAGIATGTLYNYFKNKNDLFIYIERRLDDNLLETAEEIAHSTGPADKRLNNLSKTVFSYCDEIHLVFDVSEKCGIKDLIPLEEKQQRFMRGIQIIKKIIDDGIQEKIFKEHDSDLSSQAYFFMLFGIIESYHHMGNYKQEVFRETHRSFFDNYLKK